MARAVSGLTRSACDIIGTEDAAVEGESTAWATRDFLRVLARDAFFVDFDRTCFFAVFDLRTKPSPTSANTSNIQRTRRPARSAGILIACFGIVTLLLALESGAIRMPADFIRKLGGGRAGGYKNRLETGQLDCRVVADRPHPGVRV